MKQKAASVLLAYLEGVCGLSVRFSKYSEQNVPFHALLGRRLQNRSSEVVASFKTTREIMPHPVAHAHKLFLVLRRRRPLGSHRFVSSLVTQEADVINCVLSTINRLLTEHKGRTGEYCPEVVAALSPYYCHWQIQDIKGC